MLHILKNNGSIVSYQLQKVTRSVLLSCYSAELDAYQSKIVIKNVISSLHKWLEGKEEVTTDDIRLRIAETLHSVQPQVAVLYENARNLE